MLAILRFKAWSLLARSAAAVGGALVLAACATGYAWVQPEAAGSGSYYTDTAPGYYYDEAPDWYNATGFGYDDIYGPSLTFGLGLASPCGWTCAGYFGGWPWYYDYPHEWRHRRHHHHHRGDPVASASPSHSWIHPDYPRVMPYPGRGGVSVIAVPARPVEGFASRRPLASASFAPRDFERPSMPQPSGIESRPVYRTPGISAFTERPMQADPVRSAPPHAFARPAAAPSFAPVRAAPSRSSSDHANSAKIP